MIETNKVGVVVAYGPLMEEEVINILLEFFDNVIGASQFYETENIPPSERIGSVAALPLASGYQMYGSLPTQNPQYGDALNFVPDFIIDAGNVGFFNDGSFAFDPGDLYYTFTYAE